MNKLVLFSMKLRANSLESGPPLSTILGNYGVNTIKFCKEFNEFTQDLPNYFLVEVEIIIYVDKTYNFKVNQPTVTLLLKLVSFDSDILIKGSGGYRPQKIRAIKIQDIYLISKFKFGYIDLNTITQIMGTIFSMNLYVIK